MRVAAEEGVVDVPGGRVWFGRYGAGPATPLLCLHGGPGMPSYYLQPLTELDGRAVILYDQLGCGRSERPDDPRLWTLERSLAELGAVIDALGLGRFHLLGHSWGGLLALAHALRDPTRIVSLVCASPLVSVAEWVADAEVLLDGLPVEVAGKIRAAEEAGDTDSPGYQQVTDVFYRRHFCRLAPWPEVLERTFAEMGTQCYRTMWGPSEFTQTGNLTGIDLSGRLPELGTPTLWTCGTHDEARPATVARFAQLAPGGQFVEFPDGSHCVHLEQPAHFRTRMTAFLDAHETRS